LIFHIILPHQGGYIIISSAGYIAELSGVLEAAWTFPWCL